MFQDPTFWVLVAFVIFFLAVGGKIYRAITAGLDARTAQIRQDIDEARRLREEAQAVLANTQRQQRQAADEAAAIIGQAREHAEVMGAEAAAALKTALGRRRDQAMDKIAQAEAAAVNQVRDATVDVAMAATRRILRARLKGKRADALIGAAIKELPDKLH